MNISYFPLQWYGLLVSSGVIAASLVGEWALVKKSKQLDEDRYWSVLGWVIAAGVIGARLYHVLTDWPLYADNWLATLFVWQGGMSIIGAVLGGGIALLWLMQRRLISREQLWSILDAAAVALPIGQIIGRWGNYVNQELYGLPTTLPWKVYIAPEARLSGWESFAYYHPLFLYEQLLLVPFVIWAWSRWKRGTVGRGMVFAWYVSYYAAIRIMLDFIRIDKSYLPGTLIGVNQLVLSGILVLALYWSVQRRKHQ